VRFADGLDRVREPIGAGRDVQHTGLLVAGQVIEGLLQSRRVIRLAVVLGPVVAAQVPLAWERADELLVGGGAGRGGPA
jgi:hypothetical protein